MKRWFVFACLVSAVCLALPSIAGAKTVKPTLVLEEDCFTEDLVQVYGIAFGVTGFPPDAQFTGTLTDSLGSTFGPGTLTTDENGEFTFFFGYLFRGVSWTWTVESPYLTATKAITVTCEPKPTSVEQCRNGGYLSFNFKNQGECVAFVQRGPRPEAGP